VSASNNLTINVPSLDDADADPNNEIQVLSIDSTGAALNRSFTITLSNGGGNVSWEQIGDGQGMVNWDLNGDSGPTQTVVDGGSVVISGGEGLVSVASATNTVTVNMDINSLVTDNSPDVAADFLVFYDVTEGVHNKVLINSLPGDGQGMVTWSLGDGIGSSVINDGDLVRMLGGEGIATGLTGDDIVVDLDINSLVEDNAPASNDVFVFYDVTEGVHNKIQVTDLPGDGQGMVSWVLTADAGVNQTINDGDFVDIAGGSGS
jgi:hypothetical protein